MNLKLWTPATFFTAKLKNKKAKKRKIIPALDLALAREGGWGHVVRTVDGEILSGSPKVGGEPEVFRSAKRRRALISVSATGGRSVGRFDAAAAIGRGGLGGAAAAAAAIGCRLLGSAAVTGPVKSNSWYKYRIMYFGYSNGKVFDSKGVIMIYFVCMFFIRHFSPIRKFAMVPIFIIFSVPIETLWGDATVESYDSVRETWMVFF